MSRKKSSGGGGALVAAFIVVGIVVNWWNSLSEAAQFAAIGFLVLLAFGASYLGMQVYETKSIERANKNRLCGRLKASVRLPLNRPIEINDLCHRQDSADGQGCRSHRYRHRYLQ